MNQKDWKIGVTIGRRDGSRGNASRNAGIQTEDSRALDSGEMAGNGILILRRRLLRRQSFHCFRRAARHQTPTATQVQARSGNDS